MTGPAVGVLEPLGIALAVFFTAKGYKGQAPQFIAAGFILLSGLGLRFLGVIFGIMGLVQKDRHKLCAIVGFCLNGLILLGVLGMFVIGFMA